LLAGTRSSHPGSTLLERASVCGTEDAP